MENKDRKLWVMTVLLYFFIILGLCLGIAWAAKWSDYSSLSSGNIADTDDFMMRDVSDTTLAATGTQKVYTWATMKADMKTYMDTLYQAIVTEGSLTDSVIVSADIKDGEVGYADMDGTSKALTPMADDCDNFLANFTGDNLYGGTFVANATGTCTLPAVTAGMHFTIITLGAIEIIIDPNASDSMLTDGTQQGDGENITNTSTAGDIAVVQYYSAAGWLVTTNGWTQE